MKEKLLRALKHKAVLAERSKLLKEQVDDFRTRESSMNHIASELLQRQRELNYMLHRASSVLHQMQDTNLALSAEFTHLVKELPAPKETEEGGTPEWEETMSRVNDLFRRTHELAGEMQDEIFRTTGAPVMTDPTKDVSTAAKSPITESPVTPTQPEMHVEAEPVEVERAQTVPSPSIGVPAEERPEELRPPEIASTQVIDTPVIATEEPAGIAESEPEIVDVKIVPAETESEDEAPEVESADDLFRRLNAASDLNWPQDEPAEAESPRKPSLLARIFGRGDED